MSTQQIVQPAEEASVESPRPTPAVSELRRFGQMLGPQNISALYVFVALFVIFSLWIPDLFLTTTNFKSLLGQQAVPALLAVSLVVPLAAGMFDLSIGAIVGLGAILVARLIVDGGLSPLLAVIVTLGACMLVGLVNGLLVTRAHIDSFIATLGAASVLAGLIQWISGQQISIFSPGFEELAAHQVFGITLPVYYMLAFALVVWYVLERTPVGRRIYATGGNVEAARLSGISTRTVVVASFMTVGLAAGFAGVLITSSLGNGDPTVGPAYLLAAFTAAFLGSTQFRGGRFNVWGTVVAVYVLATGVKGLQLGGGPIWIPDLFNGLALLIAVAAAKYQRNPGRTSAVARLMSRKRDSPATTAIEQRSSNG